MDPLGDDPHWWQDPVRVQRAAKEIRNELARADVDGAGYYEAATADFLARLRKLHRDVRTCLSLLDDRRAPLAAQHDGFAYFNDRYGMRIVGPARPRRSGGTEALGGRARRPGRSGGLLPRRADGEHGDDRGRAQRRREYLPPRAVSDG